MDKRATSVSTVELIQAARRGEGAAVDRLFTLAYDELRRLGHVVRRRGAGATLNTTALVHEAYLKLRPAQGLAVEDRAHFTFIVARAMRQVVVDSARRKATDKRGAGADDVTLEDHLRASPATLSLEDVIRLEESLQSLEAIEPRRAHVVECRFFGGLSVDETASALGISTPTVKRDWRVARAWLAKALGD